jgi:hypothetical protein
VNLLRTYRFELYLLTFSLLLFGSLFVPAPIFSTLLQPILILIHIATGFILISIRDKTRTLYGILFVLVLALECNVLLQFIDTIQDVRTLRFGLLSLYFTVVTVEMILQVWQADMVHKNVIFGLMGGYVSLGLVAFFLILWIYRSDPGSYSGLQNVSEEALSDHLLYHAYITLMTIGYGDIVPVKPLAQKAAVLIGLLGQFYLVILTAVVVGKYIGGEQKIH